MIARRVLTWLALAALAALGWQAMVPVWTQGLAGVTLDADGQPALWLTAAKVAMSLGGGAFVLGKSAMFPLGEDFRSATRTGIILGTGMFTTSAVLFLAMAGQPFRLWFVFANPDFGNHLEQGIAAFLACWAVTLMRRERGQFSTLVSWFGLAAYAFLLARAVMPSAIMYGAAASACLVMTFAWGRMPRDVRSRTMMIAGGLLVAFGAMEIMGGIRAAAAGGVGAAVFSAGKWGSSLQGRLAAVLTVGAPLVLLVTAIPGMGATALQDWLVLAFAMSCGMAAAAFRARSLARAS